MTIENKIWDKISEVIVTILNQYPYLLVTSSILIFCPKVYLELIGLGTFKDKYLSIIGLIFIFSLSITLVNVTKKLKEWLDIKKTQNKHLNELTKDEKIFLSPFITENLNTIYDWPGNGIVAGLKSKRIIYQASVVSMSGGDFGYNLQPWARSKLIKKMSLLE